MSYLYLLQKLLQPQFGLSRLRIRRVQSRRRSVIAAESADEQTGVFPKRAAAEQTDKGPAGSAVGRDFPAVFPLNEGAHGFPLAEKAER